jgi:hypothetical protein
MSSAPQQRVPIKSGINASDARHKRQSVSYELRRTKRNATLQERRRCIEVPGKSPTGLAAMHRAPNAAPLPQDLAQCQQMNEQNPALLPIYLSYLANEAVCLQQTHVWLAATVGLRKLISMEDPSETVGTIMQHQGKAVLTRLTAGLLHELPLLAFESAWVLINLTHDARCIR